MGRSQLKYRPTRGRGQGESARGGRGGGSEKAASGRGRGGRGGRGGGRPLESNAFRYEERNEEDEEDASADAALSSNSNRQFFAEERQYRDIGDVKESYFRTKAMQQWEADDDDGDEASGTVGVMDFAWIAEQLAAVAPSLRFEIDSKYCVDFALEDPAEEEAEKSLLGPQSTNERVAEVAPQSRPAQVTNPPNASTSELDELLALSSAAATATHGDVAPPAIAAVVSAKPEPAATGSREQENLEDWLDDVLEM